MTRHRIGGVLALCAVAAFAEVAAQQLEGDVARGETLFEECATCHTVKRGGENGVGPNLFGVFYRKAGEVADFRYSPALRRSGIAWNATTLDEFLTDPQKAVPANRMPYAGMTDPQARADVIAYLLTVTK